MNVGDKVVKKSGKPFKSTFKVGTIGSFVSNPNDPKGRPAVTIVEDGTVVSVYQLKLQNEKLL